MRFPHVVVPIFFVLGFEVFNGGNLEVVPVRNGLWGAGDGDLGGRRWVGLGLVFERGVCV